MTAAAFLTEAGIAVPAVTADEMRRVDRVAIEEVGPNLFQMMENAGRNLALAAIDVLGAGWQKQPIVALVGTGGNGGGGICAARHLANRGADVTVVVTDVAGLGGVPADQLRIYRATAGRVAASDDLPGLDPALVLDALIGYSLNGAPRGVARSMIEWVSGREMPVVALDVPSGIDSTTGEAPGEHVVASRTMTLALPKTGLDAAAVGDLWLADLGIPAEVYERVGIELPTAVFSDSFRLPLRAA